MHGVRPRGIPRSLGVIPRCFALPLALGVLLGLTCGSAGFSGVLTDRPAVQAAQPIEGAMNVSRGQLAAYDGRCQLPPLPVGVAGQIGVLGLDAHPHQGAMAVPGQVRVFWGL